MAHPLQFIYNHINFYASDKPEIKQNKFPLRNFVILQYVTVIPTQKKEKKNDLANTLPMIALGCTIEHSFLPFLFP